MTVVNLALTVVYQYRDADCLIPMRGRSYSSLEDWQRQLWEESEELMEVAKVCAEPLK